MTCAQGLLRLLWGGPEVGVLRDCLQELDQVNFVTVTIDASNLKEVELVPIVVCYFLSETGVKVKLFEFILVPEETSETSSQYLLPVFYQTGLKKKLIGFCADNCNTNFAGVKRREQYNVFFKVKIDVCRVFCNRVFDSISISIYFLN